MTDKVQAKKGEKDVLKMCQMKCVMVFLSQSTMVVLQALSEYQINKPPSGDLSLDVDMRIAGRKEIRYHFNPTTAYVARSSRVRRQRECAISCEAVA